MYVGLLILQQLQRFDLWIFWWFPVLLLTKLDFRIVLHFNKKFKKSFDRVRIDRENYRCVRRDAGRRVS